MGHDNTEPMLRECLVNLPLNDTRRVRNDDFRHDGPYRRGGNSRHGLYKPDDGR